MADQYDSTSHSHPGDSDQASKLVREVAKDAARAQGGTNHESAAKKVKKKQNLPKNQPADDLTRSSRDEMHGSGFGYTYGE